MTNYEYGFITKCAEYGVDLDELIKAAAWYDIFNPANWQVSDDAHNFENDIEARAAQHAKDLGMNRYDTDNKAGTMLSRWWNRNTKSDEEYQKWYSDRKTKEMNRDVARTNRINEFGKGLSKVNPVYSVTGNNGDASQTKTINSGNGQTLSPAEKTEVGTLLAGQPTQPAQQVQTQQAQQSQQVRPQPAQQVQTQQAQQSQQVRPQPAQQVQPQQAQQSQQVRPQPAQQVQPQQVQTQQVQQARPPQVPNRYQPVIKGRQGGTDWTGV